MVHSATLLKPAMRQSGLAMVKGLTALISSGFARRDIAPLVHRRVYRTLRRRLSDRVADVFQEACLAGDLETAEQLLAVMQNIQDRRTAAGHDRRSGDEELERAREELATRKAVRAQG